MNYEQLIEELREEMLQLVNTKCDALLQMYRIGLIFITFTPIKVAKKRAMEM